MFGLDWFVVVVVWSGVDNISFPNENGLVWIQFDFEPICRAKEKLNIGDAPTLIRAPHKKNSG